MKKLLTLFYFLLPIFVFGQTPTERQVLNSGTPITRLPYAGTTTVSATDTTIVFRNGVWVKTTTGAIGSTAPASSPTITLTGDASTPAMTSGTYTATLATVATPTTVGTSSSVPTFSVSAKGLVNTASNIPIAIAESQVTNLTSDLSGKVATTTSLTINGVTQDLSTSRSYSVATGSSQWVTATSPTTAITYTAGVVGVGTMTVNAALSIANTNTAIPTALFTGAGTTSASGFGLKVHNSSGTNNALMVRNDGFIGMGIAAPTAKLHLKAHSSLVTDEAFWVTDASGNLLFNIDNAGGVVIGNNYGYNPSSGNEPMLYVTGGNTQMKGRTTSHSQTAAMMQNSAGTQLAKFYCDNYIELSTNVVVTHDSSGDGSIQLGKFANPYILPSYVNGMSQECGMGIAVQGSNLYNTNQAYAGQNLYFFNGAVTQKQAYGYGYYVTQTIDTTSGTFFWRPSSDGNPYGMNGIGGTVESKNNKAGNFGISNQVFGSKAQNVGTFNAVGGPGTFVATVNHTSGADANTRLSQCVGTLNLVNRGKHLVGFYGQLNHQNPDTTVSAVFYGNSANTKYNLLTGRDTNGTRYEINYSGVQITHNLPATYTASATLDVDSIFKGAISVTAGTVTLTLPTGTNLGTKFNSTSLGHTVFSFTVKNSSGNNCTIAVNTDVTVSTYPTTPDANELIIATGHVGQWQLISSNGTTWEIKRIQ